MAPAADTCTTNPPAVLYAAKSTEDVHGSIPTQLDHGRALAEREGLDVVDTFFDKAASAYKGDRGPELERACARAERIAAEHGECALIVIYSTIETRPRTRADARLSRRSGSVAWPALVVRACSFAGAHSKRALSTGARPR